TLYYEMYDTPINQATLKAVQASLGKAGITVEPYYSCSGYCSIVFDPKKAGDFGVGGWGADWPNASTVIPPLFTQKGGWDLSQVDDEALNAEIDAAVAETDRTKQSALWQGLNKKAMENAYVIPTFFELTQFLAGTGIDSDGLFLWGPYGSLSYGAISVKK